MLELDFAEMEINKDNLTNRSSKFAKTFYKLTIANVSQDSVMYINRNKHKNDDTALYYNLDNIILLKVKFIMSIL